MALTAAGLAALWCGTAAGVEARSPGKWLVDLGRDYPLTPQAGLSAVDAEIALLFMQAAARAEPQLGEAYRWQIDLLRVLGREDEVRRVLEAYVRLAPDDEGRPPGVGADESGWASDLRCAGGFLP